MITTSMKAFRLNSVIAALGLALFAAPVFADSVTSHDKGFIKDADHAGHTEIEGGKLARAHTKNADIQAYADTLVKDHTKTGEELKAIAQRKGVELPGDPSLVQKANLKLLSTKDAADFDKAFVQKIGIDAHQDTIKLFQEAAAKSDDAEVQAFAKKTIPGLEHHLKLAQELQAKVGK